MVRIPHATAASCAELAAQTHGWPGAQGLLPAGRV